jgi:hypothetical protein
MNIKMMGVISAAMMFATAAVGQSMAPQGDKNAPTNAMVKHHDVHATADPASGANSFTQSQARTRIAKGGFAHVSMLKKDEAGLWQGTAMKDGRKVHVALDYKGDVTSK